MTRDTSLLVALFCAVACSTYDESLLTGPLDASGAGAATAGATHIAGRGPSSAGASGSEPGVAGAGTDAGDAGDAGSDPGVGGAATGLGGAAGNGVGGGLVEGGSGPTAGSSSTSELLDDFEDQDAFVLPLHKRNGPWYVFSDATAGGKLTPLTIALLGGTPSHEGSTAGLHLTASGFTDWGVGVGADLVNTAGKKVAYDVSAYTGIRFYAKVATGSQTVIKVLFPTVYSDAEGGKCNDTVTTKRCSDHLFHTVTGLRPIWDQYEVDFADLVQQGFGLPQASLDPTGVYSVQFTQATKLLPVDLWIDDVSFITR